MATPAQRIKRAWTGHRIGDSHPRTKLSDRDVELIRQLHERHGIGYGTIAKKFDTPRSTIATICRYQTRTHC